MHTLTTKEARRIWLRAQRLDEAEPFGHGPEATRRAIAHLGYVQIDTINVIERCHHHILFTRIPKYRRTDLQHAQSVEKSVFEYWTHALAYVPTAALPHFLAEMRRRKREPGRWFDSVEPMTLRKVLRRIRADGPITMRDFDGGDLVEKDHPWASRKPEKRALQLAFFAGDLVVNARHGMVKSYELADRHFGWDKRPKPTRDSETIAYLLDRALTAQGVVSLDSICHLAASRKPVMRALIDRRVRQKALLPVRIEGAGDAEHWIAPETLEAAQVAIAGEPRVHILSPFDPLIIQRKRLAQFFGYEHRFEAYVPKEKRILGYFALPVLVGDEIVAALDLKADRAAKTLLVQQWTWIGRKKSAALKRQIEAELCRFEKFQLD